MRVVGLLAVLASALPAAPVDFNTDVRPILSEHCYTCHGPDVAARKSSLRLDNEASAKSVIHPGDPAQSELIRRVTATDARRMPPAWAGKAALPEHDIDLLKRWIVEGAQWEKHWSFVPPRRPDT